VPGAVKVRAHETAATARNAAAGKRGRLLQRIDVEPRGRPADLHQVAQDAVDLRGIDAVDLVKMPFGLDLPVGISITGTSMRTPFADHDGRPAPDAGAAVLISRSTRSRCVCSTIVAWKRAASTPRRRGTDAACGPASIPSQTPRRSCGPPPLLFHRLYANQLVVFRQAGRHSRLQQSGQTRRQCHPGRMTIRPGTRHCRAAWKPSQIP
jgi:hypothetical protein